MMRSLLVAALFGLPLAGATGTLEAGPASVDISNGQTEDCIEEVTDLCLASRTGDSPSETTINAEQRFEHLWVQIDDSEAERATSHELLPDGTILFIDSNTVTPGHPVFIILSHNVGTVRAPADAIVIIFEKDEFGVQFLYPNRTEDGVVIERWDGLSGPYSEHGGLEYDRLGPVLVGGVMWNSDASLEDDARYACRVLREPLCHEEDAAFVAATMTDALPTVIMAAEIVETGIGGGPGDESIGDGSLSRNAIDAPLLRAPVPNPLSPRDRVGSPGRSNGVPRPTDGRGDRSFVVDRSNERAASC